MSRLLGMLVVALVIGLGVVQILDLPNGLVEALSNRAYRAFIGATQYRITELLLTPVFLGALAGTLLLERLMPAVPGQRVFSVALAQDFVWFFYEAILHAAVVLTWVFLVTRVHATLLGGVTFGSIAEWPTGARLLIGFLATDFLFWWQHWLHHRIPLLWRFHRLHHSQTALNFFTDFRYHVVEYIVRQTVLVVPMLLLGIEFPTLLAYTFVVTWYTRFCHANVRTRLGPLRHVVVTPQFHRIHHSIESRHHDRNFGSVLSVWDRLFGTRSEDERSYPGTGLAGDPFPLERSVRPDRLLWQPIAQLLEPLTGLLDKRRAPRRFDRA